MKKGVFYTVIFLLSFFGNAQNNALFDQGKQQYKADNFQEAIANWNKIIAAGDHSAALYFNLGNAHYKLNNLGPSIYYYEKALGLAPNDTEVLNNLAFAQNATIDVIEPLPQTVFAKWDATLSSWLTFDGWASVAVGCSLLFTLLFLLYYFSTLTQKKRLLFVGSILSLLVLLIALTMSFRMFKKEQTFHPAIIFAESTEIKSDPKMNSETLFSLHEGTKVQIIAEDGNWKRIQLVDGKDGWIPEEDLKEL